MPEKIRTLIFRINPARLRAFDRAWKAHGFKSRTHAIRDILSKWTKTQGKITPTIKELEKRIEELEQRTAPKVGGQPCQR